LQGSHLDDLVHFYIVQGSASSPLPFGCLFLSEQRININTSEAAFLPLSLNRQERAEEQLRSLCCLPSYPDIE
jgi:hypothetical protein